MEEGIDLEGGSRAISYLLFLLFILLHWVYPDAPVPPSSLVHTSARPVPGAGYERKKKALVEGHDP